MLFTTGPIENKAVNGTRLTQQVTITIENKDAVYLGVISIQGFVLGTTRTLYVLDTFSIGVNSVVTRTFFANLDSFEFKINTSGAAEESIEVSAWGKDSTGSLVAAHRLISSEL
ncbi:hypothetical protein M3231_06190 [Neobacillus mesonae]|nr:hypothetical protein [Neobacillus mesonae]